MGCWQIWRNCTLSHHQNYKDIELYWPEQWSQRDAASHWLSAGLCTHPTTHPNGCTHHLNCLKRQGIVVNGLCLPWKQRVKVRAGLGKTREKASERIAKWINLSRRDTPKLKGCWCHETWGTELKNLFIVLCRVWHFFTAVLKEIPLFSSIALGFLSCAPTLFSNVYPQNIRN